MNKILKKRVNIKRKETINKRLLIQVIFSIILVISVILTKQFGNNYTGKFLDSAQEKLNENFDFKHMYINIRLAFQKLGDSLSFGLFGDDYAAPVSGKIFKRYDAVESNDSAKYQHGIDIISNIESVKSISKGKVILVGNNEKLSNYLVVESGNKKIVYAKFNEVFVAKGDVIELGEIIGKLQSDDKILHIEVWENGKSIDPTKLFKLYE